MVIEPMLKIDRLFLSFKEEYKEKMSSPDNTQKTMV